MYNVGPTSSTLVQYCTNVIQMFCGYHFSYPVGDVSRHVTFEVTPTLNWRGHHTSVDVMSLQHGNYVTQLVFRLSQRETTRQLVGYDTRLLLDVRVSCALAEHSQSTRRALAPTWIIGREHLWSSSRRLCIWYRTSIKSTGWKRRSIRGHEIHH